MVTACSATGFTCRRPFHNSTTTSTISAAPKQIQRNAARGSDARHAASPDADIGERPASPSSLRPQRNCSTPAAMPTAAVMKPAGQP